METGEAPQPTTLETARNIAFEKGSERRQEAAKRISGFLSGIKEKVTRGVDFALGSPDAAFYLGTEAVKFGKEKAIDPVVEAGTRACESIVDSGERLVKRGMDAGHRLVDRCKQIRDANVPKVVDLSRRAALLGLTKVAVPIEDRLRQIYEVPANIRDWQAKREAARAQKQEIKAKLAREAGEARVRALQEEIARTQEAISRRVDFLNGLRDTALARSEELNGKVTRRREQGKKNFDRARTAVQKLQTR